ncbi:histidinol-phosphate transaminase [Natronoglycomyces albus]|uniref:Aromatic amino acid aminotransferase n=1 Tax=Natronoglycomyces albus TaxID=2811108 RepID=A0A895XQL1_9ACTN|nr:histidinol-phosphate transaminase [Natronoglycomyces albus]QSB05659.1 histidinol-phosphate transaminase [Natronoglycomyces albus]
MTRPLREDLLALPKYVPGKSPEQVAAQLGLDRAVKLASNEVAYGPLPGVPEAIGAAAASVNRYPDMGVVALKGALSQRLGVDTERITVGCGSVGLLMHLMAAIAEPGAEVVYSWRSFEAYPIAVQIAQMNSVRVPNTADHRHNLEAMAEAIGPKTKAVFVCNPNNPTGESLTAAEITAFLDKVPSDVLVVIDEAYREFVTDPDVPDGLELYGDRENVVILRTFSKAWGLAGLRAGYLIGSPDVAQTVHKIVVPFSVNSLAQAAAVAALAAEEEMRRRVDEVVQQRERVLAEARKLIDGVPGTQTNFVWLPLRDRAVEFAQLTESKAVTVRPFAGDGVRVSIGTPEENDLFLEILHTWK